MTNYKFKHAAKKHQIRYREDKLNVGYNTYVTWLNDDAGIAGMNFYEGFEIFKVVRERYPNFYIDLYSDMLRSEHIPFNLFVPFRYDLKFCKSVLNEIMGSCIKSIEKTSVIDSKDNIKIEFAPSPKEKYLNDGTSFDAYIEYIHTDNSRGLLGIEVKYTEKEYKLKLGLKEDLDINNCNSLYYSITESSQIYNPDISVNELKIDLFRQIWRNQILAESIRLKHKNYFQHSTSLTFYPEGNEHFTDISEKYIKKLKDKSNKYIPVTYEKFITACELHCPNDDFKNWINYLKERYLVLGY